MYVAKKLFTTITDDNPFKKLYSWSSPERLWVKKDRAWYVSYSLFFIVLIAFLALLGELLLILTVLAFVLLWFVQGATPAQTIEHTITSLGIRTFDTFYRWQNIKHFWFSKKGNITLLNLETFEDKNPDFVKRISLLLTERQDEEIFKILISFLDYGDKKELSFNPIMQIINGAHIDSSEYLDESRATLIN